MNQVGYVSKIEKDMAIVNIKRASACGDNCSSCGGKCNMPVVKVKIKNILNSKPGDYVMISSNTKLIMKAAFIVYVLPLISLIIGIGVSGFVLNNFGVKEVEIYSLLIGLGFLVSTYVIINRIDKSLKAKGIEEFKMENIL